LFTASQDPHTGQPAGDLINIPWPCRTVSDNLFGSGFQFGVFDDPVVDPQICKRSYNFDFGCVQCAQPIDIQMRVDAWAQIPFGSAYSFQVTAAGEWIG
jgi:hypothetical protein